MAVAAIPFIRQFGLGATGLDVEAVKRALIKTGKGVGVTDTQTFGAQAVAALKAFQAMCKITADGIYGPTTHNYLMPYFDAYGVSLLQQEATALATAYRNPYRDVVGLAFAGYDQGVDFSGAGRVYAVGPAVVTVATQSSGWPGGGAVSYRLTAGKAAGKTIYLAENITHLVSVGQKVTAQTVVAVMHNAYPYTESGFARDGTDNPMSQPISHAPTFFGVNFGRFLVSLGETRCPARTGGQDTPLPAGWPDWLPV